MCIMVPEKNLNKGNTGQLNLVCFHSSLLNYCFFFSFIYFTLQVIRGRGTSGRVWGRRPQQLATSTMGHGGLPLLPKLAHRLKTTYTLVDSTWGNASHFHRDLERNPRHTKNMVMCFTRPLQHGSDLLHLLPLPPQSRTPSPMGINLGM